MMDAKKMGKQMLDFYKTSFDNSYSAMMMLEEQMERMSAMFLGQMGNLPEEAKKGFTEWTKSYKKNCEDSIMFLYEIIISLYSFLVEADKGE